MAAIPIKKAMAKITAPSDTTSGGMKNHINEIRAIQLISVNVRK